MSRREQGKIESFGVGFAIVILLSMNLLLWHSWNKSKPHGEVLICWVMELPGWLGVLA
jgi:hypothetical protein